MSAEAKEQSVDNNVSPKVDPEPSQEMPEMINLDEDGSSFDIDSDIMDSDIDPLDLDVPRFWSLKVVANDSGIITEDIVPGFQLHLTSASFGMELKENTRTVLLCQEGPEVEAVSLCVLDNNRQHTALNLIFNGLLSLYLTECYWIKYNFYRAICSFAAFAQCAKCKDPMCHNGIQSKC